MFLMHTLSLTRLHYTIHQELARGSELEHRTAFFFFVFRRCNLVFSLYLLYN